jgi:hypothetical protein
MEMTIVILYDGRHRRTGCVFGRSGARFKAQLGEPAKKFGAAHIKFAQQARPTYV